MVALVGVGKGKLAPGATLRGGERHCAVIEQRHRSRIIFHRGCGESRFTDLLSDRTAFDTAGDSLGGLVGGENRVLTPEISLVGHGIVGEWLHVILCIAFAPRKVRGELAPAIPLGDGACK